MEMTMCFPLLLLICSLSTAQLQSDNEIVPHHAESQGGEPTNVSEHQQTCLQHIHAVLSAVGKYGNCCVVTGVQAAELITVKARSYVTENQVEALKRDAEVKQVAFSASLSLGSVTTIGPFNTETNLVFRYVFSNIGNAYNPNTGSFIAPVRGSYHFEFYIGANGHSSHPSAAALFKNRERVCTAWEHQPSGYGTSANGATLLLEVGDVVFLRLIENSRIYDSDNHYSTFSGHLLFTM